METTRRQERRRTRHGTKLARRAIGEAGHPKKVGEALGVTRSAACHWKSDRVHPALREAFEVLLRLDAYPEVSGRAFAEAAAEAVELSEIVHADTEVLLPRGLYLMAYENETDKIEDDATVIGPEAHAEALRKHGSAVMELASILDELLFRGIDLHAEYRARRVAA